MVATFLIEIAVPPLFFAPIRRLRLAAFYSQVGESCSCQREADRARPSALLSVPCWGQGGSRGQVATAVGKAL